MAARRFQTSNASTSVNIGEADGEIDQVAVTTGYPELSLTNSQIDTASNATSADNYLEGQEYSVEGVVAATKVVEDSLEEAADSLENGVVQGDVDVISQQFRDEKEAEEGLSVLLDQIFRDSTLAIDAIGALNPVTVENLIGPSSREEEKQNSILSALLE